MKSTPILCAAFLAVGTAATSAASIVGYYNLTVAPNAFVLLANQLNSTNNTLGSVIADGPDGAVFQKFNGSYNAYVYDGLAMAWSPDGLATLNPGEGGFYKSPTATTLTFVGRVLQGSLTNTLPIAVYAIRSSMVPQQGLITTDLAVPGEDGDIAQFYSGSYSAFTYDGLSLAWSPYEPTSRVGSAFFYKKSPLSTQSLWVRDFTVP